VPSRLQGLSWEGSENLVSRIFKNVHFPKLRLFDMAQASSNIVEDFLHGQHLCELRWIHWQEAKIKEIPFNFGHCPNLRVFDLSKCINLKVLPTYIEKLTTLQHFSLSMCSKSQTLPTSINKLIALQELHLSGCSNDVPPSSLCDPKRVQRVGFVELDRNLVPLPASSTKRGRGVVLEAPGLN
jgi:hypothetical protein